MPWGGTALYDVLGLSPREELVGEAWLVSDHPKHVSVINGGSYDGWTLGELVRADPVALLGTEADRFPLLVKVLDAQQNLSVQVHPDDERAKQWAPGEGGKTEAWTVLATGPTGGAIYLGLRAGIDTEAFRHELLAGNAQQCLVRHTATPGETYFVPAGAVHALGEQVMVLEVQQTSDATFRLYDWGRIGVDGKPRALHLEAGLACTIKRPEAAGLQTAVPEGEGRELLVRSSFFRTYRRLGTGQGTVRAPAVVVGWEGNAWVGGQCVRSAETVLVPASLGQVPVDCDSGAQFFEIRWD